MLLLLLYRIVANVILTIMHDGNIPAMNVTIKYSMAQSIKPYNTMHLWIYCQASKSSAHVMRQDAEIIHTHSR